MKIIIFVLLALAFKVTAFGQTETIIVENIVEFYIYNDINYSNTDAVNFILKVTNQTKNPIPDLGVMNRSEHVNFYINGQKNNPLSLYNGVESIYGEKTIGVNSSQSFESGGWLLTADSGIVEKYGHEFTVQWEYMEIKSKIIKVNIRNKMIELID